MNTESQSIELQVKKGSLKAWFLASRPKTLTISVVPILVGIALAQLEVKTLNWFLIFSNLMCVLWIQMGMNYINDALDDQKSQNLIKKSVSQRANLLTSRQFLIGGYSCFALAIFFGIPLILAGGWPFALLILVSVSCGYLYTGGPYPLSYIGIGNLFIFIFYGLANTAAIYYLQTGYLSESIFLAGSQLGCLAIVPHAVNNLRDHQSDILVKKKTLAVRFGIFFARWEISSLSLIPFVLGFFWMTLGNVWMALLPFLILPLILRNIIDIWRTPPSLKYNKYLGISVLCQLIFGILLSVGSYL